MTYFVSFVSGIIISMNGTLSFQCHVDELLLILFVTNFEKFEDERSTGSSQSRKSTTDLLGNKHVGDDGRLGVRRPFIH
jgi:hypothetical protein